MSQASIPRDLTSAPVIKRHPLNPILTAAQVPYPASLVFNAGVTRYQGQYVMVFRNDFFKEDGNPGSFSHTDLGLATSPDGVRGEVQPTPCWSWQDEEVSRVYDPRLTVIDGRCCICCAVDTRHGILGGIAVTDDFSRFDVLSLSTPDNRNMVLFPEKVDGKFVRLERPMPIYSRGRDRFDIWCSDSPDLTYWGNSRLVMGVEHVPFANDKIGPGAPPVKTRLGWLAVFHAVDRDNTRGRNGWEER